MEFILIYLNTTGMSALQKEFYVKVLMNDLHHLNAVGVLGAAVSISICVYALLYLYVCVLFRRSGEDSTAECAHAVAEGVQPPIPV